MTDSNAATAEAVEDRTEYLLPPVFVGRHEDPEPEPVDPMQTDPDH